jgi:serine/threonine protein kinase
VVLKRVLPHLAEADVFVEMFLNEARLAANLDHPNIAQVIDFGSEAAASTSRDGVRARPLGARAPAPPRQAAAACRSACALTIVHEVAAALHTPTSGRPRRAPAGARAPRRLALATCS